MRAFHPTHHRRCVMERFKISRQPATEIFVVKAEYQSLDYHDKLEMLELATEWINNEIKLLTPPTETKENK